MFARAEDIPIELYDLILYFLNLETPTTTYQAAQVSRNEVATNKQELGQLALVCHLWAHVCQSKIFNIVVLRSQAEFRELLALSAHPHSRIAQYIEHLNLFVVNNSAPWIHAVCLKIRPRSKSPLLPGSPFPNFKGHSLLFDRDQAHIALSEGPHASLPRSQLPAFSRNIKTLGVLSMSLSSIGDIVRLVSELPSLKRLACMDVTWTEPPRIQSELLAPLARRSRRRSQSLQQVAMLACAESWHVLALLCLFDISHPVLVDDLAVVAELPRALVAERETSNLSIPGMTALQRDSCYALCMRATDDRLLAPYLIVATAKCRSPNTTRSWRVDVIVLDFSPAAGGTITPLADMRNFAWESFDARAAQLSALRHLIVGLTSLDDLAYFAKEIEPKMSRLSTSGQLKYALEERDLEKDQAQCWVACEAGCNAEDLMNARRVGVNDVHLLYS